MLCRKDLYRRSWMLKLTTYAYHKAHMLSGTAGQKQDSTASQREVEGREPGGTGEGRWPRLSREAELGGVASWPTEPDFSGDLCPFWSASRERTLPRMLRDKESDGLRLLCPMGSVVPVFRSFSVSWKSVRFETSLSPSALFPKAASVLIAIMQRLKKISEFYFLSNRAAFLWRVLL